MKAKNALPAVAIIAAILSSCLPSLSYARGKLTELAEVGRELSEVASNASDRRMIDPNAPYVVGFTPGGNGQPTAENVVLAAIGEAHESIIVAAYAFTNSAIAKALVAAKRRGIDVRVIADKKENTGGYTAVTFMANEGVPCVLNGQYAIHHHKFIVIDGKNVEQGSFNFTAAAAKRNAEDALLIRNNPGLAAIYTKEWVRLWNESERVSARY